MLDTMQQILQDLKHSSSQIREAALDRVGEMEPDRAIPLLVPFLSDSDEGVRETAASNLGFIRENAAIPYLVKTVKEDSSEKVRAQALLSLAEYRSPEILDCLIKEVQREKRSRPPRQYVAQQLRYYDSEAAVDALITLLQDEDVFVRDHAAVSLFQLNRPRLHNVWEAALEDRSQDVQMIAKKALSDLGY
jgi:HEAT repeat protein